MLVDVWCAGACCAGLCVAGCGVRRVTQGAADAIRAKAVIAYFPVRPPPPSLLPVIPLPGASTDEARPLHIAWNHRWEHDKAPDVFFAALDDLVKSKLEFKVTVLGQRFSQSPPEFDSAFKTLSSLGAVVHWGYAPTKMEVRRRAAIACPAFE